MKSSRYYFDMKTKILADFQICISVPLKRVLINFTINFFDNNLFKSNEAETW